MVVRSFVGAGYILWIPNPPGHGRLMRLLGYDALFIMGGRVWNPPLRNCFARPAQGSRLFVAEAGYTHGEEDQCKREQNANMWQHGGQTSSA